MPGEGGVLIKVSYRGLRPKVQTLTPQHTNRNQNGTPSISLEKNCTSYTPKIKPSDSVRKLGKLCGISRRSRYAAEKVCYAANYVISPEKISHRTRTVIRFTTTLKISEALHEVSSAK